MERKGEEERCNSLFLVVLLVDDRAECLKYVVIGRQRCRVSWPRFGQQRRLARSKDSCFQKAKNRQEGTEGKARHENLYILPGRQPTAEVLPLVLWKRELEHD